METSWSLSAAGTETAAAVLLPLPDYYN